MHLEGNLAVMSYYSHITEGMNMFIHLGFEWALYIRELCFRFNCLVVMLAQQYVYAWRHLNISTQEASSLIPQVRQSHQMG